MPWPLSGQPWWRPLLQAGGGSPGCDHPLSGCSRCATEPFTGGAPSAIPSHEPVPTQHSPASAILTQDEAPTYYCNSPYPYTAGPFKEAGMDVGSLRSRCSPRHSSLYGSGSGLPGVRERIGGLRLQHRFDGAVDNSRIHRRTALDSPGRYRHRPSRPCGRQWRARLNRVHGFPIEPFGQLYGHLSTGRLDAGAGAGAHRLRLI